MPLAWLVPHIVGTDPNTGPTAAAIDEAGHAMLGAGAGAGIGASVTAWPPRPTSALRWSGSPLLLVEEIRSGDRPGMVVVAILGLAIGSVWLLAPTLVTGAFLGALADEAAHARDVRRGYSR